MKIRMNYELGFMKKAQARHSQTRHSLFSFILVRALPTYDFGMEKPLLKFGQGDDLGVGVCFARGNHNQFIIVIIQAVNDSDALPRKFRQRFKYAQNVGV